MKVKSFLKGFAATGMALAAAGTTPVFAAGTPTENGKGVQPGTQSFGSAASPASTSGDIKLTYDTSGGSWQDPGTDPNSPDDNKTHDNGTYLVTIPTAITYENMPIGTVSTSDDYTVNVRGVIGTDNEVMLTAETGELLETFSNDDRAQAIHETTTQNKIEWDTDETFGNLNKDGSLSGTDTTDTIALSGTAKVAGKYFGTVAYKAELLMLPPSDQETHP